MNEKKTIKGINNDLINFKNILDRYTEFDQKTFDEMKNKNGVDISVLLSNKKYIANNLSAKQIDNVENYIKLILLKNDKNKYLSKNNLNYKRIDLIQSILPHSIFLIPIRKPLQQANSLLSQHLHFNQLHQENDFIRRYMNYLGHHEFGLNHKPWNNPIHFSDSNNINYWIEQWCLFYELIYQKFQYYKNCHFVIYEELHNPSYVQKILNKINLEKSKNIDLQFFRNSNKKDINIEYDKNIFNKSQLIYKNFL